MHNFIKYRVTFKKKTLSVYFDFRFLKPQAEPHVFFLARSALVANYPSLSCLTWDRVDLEVYYE